MSGVIESAILDTWDDLYDFYLDTYGVNSGHSPVYDVLEGATFIGSIDYPAIAIEYTGYVLDGRVARGIVLSFNLWTILIGDEISDRESIAVHSEIADATNTHLKAQNATPTISTPEHGHIIGQTPFEIEFEGAGFLRIVRNAIEVKALICSMD